MTRSTCSISVAIPYYKDENYLFKALQSVAAQTETPYEIIVSMDNAISNQLCAKIDSLNLQNLLMIPNECPGIANNWNNCINHSSGSHVVIMHSDDELDAEYIAQMSRVIEENNSFDLYFCDVRIIDEESGVKFSFPDFVKSWIRPKGFCLQLAGDEGLSQLMKGCFIFCPTIVYSRDIVVANPFNSDWHMVLDLELYVRLLFAGKRFMGINRKLYNYRRHDASQTATLTTSLQRFQEEIQMFEAVALKSKQRGWIKTHAVARRKQIVRLHLWYLCLMALLKGNIAVFLKLVRMSL